MKSRKTHLINEKGEKLVVDTRDFNISQQNGDGKYDDYEVDVNWYLSNGYMTLEDMRKSIEGQLIDKRIISQEEIDQNEWLSIDDAKDETIESIRKIYESDD